MTANDYRAHMAAIADRIELVLTYISIALFIASSAALIFLSLF